MMDDFIKILELAHSEELPEKIDKESDISVYKMKELIDNNCLTAIDVSDLGGPGFIQPTITIAGREYLKKLIKENRAMNTGNIKLFISHSSKDEDFVKLLVKLIHESLNLPSSQIRCTSIDEHRLPAGANTDETLKRELNESNSFIGVISTNSNNSMYVAFELGARWGAKLPLIPLLAPGVDTKILKGPLTAINALKSDNRSQLEQLLTDLADELEMTKEPAVIYDETLQKILNIQSNELPQNTPAPKIEIIEISDSELKILTLISNASSRYITAQQAQSDIQVHLTKVDYLLDQLREKHYIKAIINSGGPTRYYLSSIAKAYLVENDCL